MYDNSKHNKMKCTAETDKCNRKSNPDNHMRTQRPPEEDYIKPHVDHRKPAPDEHQRKQPHEIDHDLSNERSHRKPTNDQEHRAQNQRKPLTSTTPIIRTILGGFEGVKLLSREEKNFNYCNLPGRDVRIVCGGGQQFLVHR